jgi:hypothetical protein
MERRGSRLRPGLQYLCCRGPTVNAALAIQLQHDQGANAPDPNLLTGGGQAELQLGVLRRCAARAGARVGVDVSYFRRWCGNFPVWDDRSAGPSDYDWRTHGSARSAYRVEATYCRCAISRAIAALERQLSRHGAKTETWQGSISPAMSVCQRVDAARWHERRLSFATTASLPPPSRDSARLHLARAPGFFFAARPLEPAVARDPWRRSSRAWARAYCRIDVQVSATFQTCWVRSSKPTTTHLRRISAVRGPSGPSGPFRSFQPGKSSAIG